MYKLKKILAIAIVFIICISLIGCKSRLQRIQEYLNNDNYIDAATLVNRIKNEEDKTSAIDMLKEKAEETKQEFLDGKIDGTRAISNIQAFRDVENMEEFIGKMVDEINSLMISQKAFLDGERAEKENDYNLAYESYYAVIIDDKANYEKAQEKLVQLEDTIKNSSPIIIEKSSIIVNSKNNKELYPDQIQVLLKNKSNKIINKFNLSILGFDGNGNSVEIQGKYTDVKDYEFLGSAENIKVKPNETWGGGYAWSLSSNTDLKNILDCVVDVQYSDGSSWTNPLYKPWLDRHKQKTLT